MTEIRFIAGSGRSGTTWILDALASANKLRPVFEPLHPYLSEVGREYAHRALSADEDHPRLREFLLSVCAGRGPRLWTQYRQQRRWLVPPAERFWSKSDAGRTKRHWVKFLREMPRMTASGFRRESLIKCIRANLMLTWIADNLKSRVVLVVRHPGAVVESELRNGWNASVVLERFREDRTLHSVTADRYRPLLSRKLNAVEALTVRWIIENQWVMESVSTRGLCVVFYEHLRSSENQAWVELCAALGLNCLPDRAKLAKPSQQSHPARSIVTADQKKSPRWIKGLTLDQKRQIAEILRSVDLSTYTMDDPNPLTGLGANKSGSQFGVY